MFNYDKCKIVFVGTGCNNDYLRLTNGNKIEIVSEFKYIGSACSKKWLSRCRSKYTYNQSSRTVHSSHYTTESRYNMKRPQHRSWNYTENLQFVSYYINDRLHSSSGTWSLRKQNEKRLDRFDQRWLRKILWVNWWMKFTNEETRKTTGRPAVSQVITVAVCRPRRRRRWPVATRRTTVITDRSPARPVAPSRARTHSRGRRRQRRTSSATRHRRLSGRRRRVLVWRHAVNPQRRLLVGWWRLDQPRWRTVLLIGARLLVWLSLMSWFQWHRIYASDWLTWLLIFLNGSQLFLTVLNLLAWWRSWLVGFCVDPLEQSEYIVTEVCRCLTGRAATQSDYTHSAAVVIHYIIQVSCVVCRLFNSCVSLQWFSNRN